VNRSSFNWDRSTFAETGQQEEEEEEEEEEEPWLSTAVSGL